MSNENTAHGTRGIGEERGTTTNIPQCFLVLGSTCALATALIAGSALKEKYLGGQNTVTVTLTGEQRGLADALTYQMPTFQGLPITCSGNQEEINILKASGKDGYYIFCNQNKEITYWKIQSGVSEKGDTFTLTW